MAQVNLSSLSGPELRALYDATRERGEAAQAYKILQEMAARRADGRGERGGGDRGGLFGARRPPEPRVIEVDPGDPLDPEDDVPPLPPNWRPQAPMLTPAPQPERQATSPPPRSRRPKTPASAEEPVKVRPVKVRPVKIAPVKVAPVKVAPPPPLTAAAPVKVAPPPPITAVKPAEVEVEPAEVEPLAPIGEVEPLPPIATVHFRHAATDDDPAPLADGLVQLDPPEAAAEDPQAWDLPPPARKRRPARARSLGPRLAAVFAVGVAAGVALGVWMGETVHAPPRQPTLAAFRAAVQPQPEAAAPIPEAPPQVVSQAAPIPEAPPEGVPAAPSAAGGCAAQPTPADRTICGDPELRQLQRDLRQAYGRALAVHRDRNLLRAHQLAWASGRDGVSDPHVLARLYSQRIRKLNAAAADARRRS
jgi:hypothetical protein